jgi:outer membrane protein insertion porin family
MTTTSYAIFASSVTFGLIFQRFQALPDVVETLWQNRTYHCDRSMRILAVVLFAVTVFAQTPAPKKREPPPGPLKAIHVTGNTSYTAEAIVASSGLKVGQKVSPALIEQARKRLQDFELFNSVAFEYHTAPSSPPEYDVTFQLVENKQVFPMRFERLGDPEAIRAYLKEHVDLYADKIPGTDHSLQRYRAAVEAFVNQTTPNTKVRAAVSNDDPNDLTVLFTPNVPAPTISQVEVTGNEAVDTGSILRAVNEVAIGVPLSEVRLKMILDGAIRPVYAAKGYAAVSFPKVEVEPAKTNSGVIVKVTIHDGPLFKFGNVRFIGKGLEEDEVRSAITFKPGQTFNAEQMDNFRIELMARMKRRGLLDSNITNELVTDDSKKTVNVLYHVSAGEVYNFARLDIRGLDMESQPVIEKLWGEKPGHFFNPDYPDFFLKKVKEQGLFDNLANTTSDYTKDEATHTVTVHLYFKGGKSEKDKERDKREEERKKNDPN